MTNEGRRRSDTVMRLLARVMMHVFFRHVEVEHGDRLPTDVPVLVVANHTNGLVDGLLLIAMLRRYPRFLAKAPLFKIVPLRPFLALAGVVPVHRPKDGDGTARNEATFRTCRELLAAGGVVAVFPEGISHDETSLQPLRTGAARIALGAAFDEGAKDLVVVPVGLAYDNKARFRSRALVTVGEPVPLRGLADAFDADPRIAVRTLTDDMAAAMRTVGPDYTSPAQADELADIADVVALPGGEPLPVRADLGDRETIARRLARLEQAGIDRGDMEDLKAAHRLYRRDLALIGVADASVAAAVTPARLRATLVWSLVKAVLAAPVAAAGFAVHIVPYEIVKRIARRPRNEGVKSSLKVVGCFLLYLVEYVVLASLAAGRFGWLAGGVVFVACPLAGYVTVRFTERLYRIGGLVKGGRVLRGRRAILASVHDNRERVRQLALALLEPRTA